MRDRDNRHTYDGVNRLLRSMTDKQSTRHEAEADERDENRCWPAVAPSAPANRQSRDHHGKGEAHFVDLRREQEVSSDTEARNDEYGSKAMERAQSSQSDTELIEALPKHALPGNWR